MRTTSALVLILGAALLGCSSSDDGPDVDYVAFGSSASTVTIAWVPNPSATAYAIERGRGDDDLAVIAAVPGSATSYLDTGLDPLTTYSYRFTAVTADGAAVAEPIEHARTTDDELLITGEPVAIDDPVVATVGADGAAIAVDVIGASVVVPPGALPDGTELTIQPVAGPFDDDPDGVGVVVTATAEAAAPIDVVFTFDDADALEPDNLGVALQADDGSWIAQPRVIDPDARTMTFALTPDAQSPANLWAAPIRYHAAVAMRSTYIMPRKATVKVGKTLGLTPYGQFSDDPCDDPADEVMCTVGVAALLSVGAVDVHDAFRPAHRFSRPLANMVPHYERDWTVEGAINGNAAVGTISANAGTGAVYKAPAAAPSKRMVAVRFTSVRTSPTRRAVTPVPAMITIHDPGSVLVTAKFRASDTQGWTACPLGSVEVWDQITFSITVDDQLAYHVEAITNQPTELGPLTFPPGETGGWTTEPEVFTMTGGTATTTNFGGEDTLLVSVLGTSTAGVCYMGDSGDEDGDEWGPFMFFIHSDFSVTSSLPYWTITAEPIESP